MLITYVTLNRLNLTVTTISRAKVQMTLPQMFSSRSSIRLKQNPFLQWTPVPAHPHLILAHDTHLVLVILRNDTDSELTL